MYDNTIIEHLQSMCEAPTDIKVISAEKIQDGAIFAVFTFGEDEDKMTAIYYPDDDSLFTPTDWQGRRPKSVDEIADYGWMSSAGDEAIVMGGLPRAFVTFRTQYRKNFGRRVAAARNDKGLSQPELSRLSGINQANLSRIESGRYSVTLDTMARLSAVLGNI